MILLTIALYFSKHRLEQNRNLENLLVEAIAPSIRGTITVEAIRIGFFSVYLHNIEVSLPMQAIHLEIPTIKVGLSFAKLLESRGDIPAAINRIVLIKPLITFSLEKKERGISDTTASPLEQYQSEMGFSKSALQVLTLKDGSINICDLNGTVISAASHLSGMLFNKLYETVISVTGNFGSSQKNLSLQGSFSFAKNRHHLSVRIANARIDKSLVIKTTTISNGSLNGAIECTFDNNLHPDSIEVHGWVTLADGSVTFAKNTHKFSAVTARMILDNSKCRFSSISALYHGIQINGHGEWYFAKTPFARAILSGTEFTPDSLYGFIPIPVVNHLSAVDTLVVKLGWRPYEDITVAFSTKGLKIKETLIDDVTAGVHISSDKFTIDSMHIATDLFNARIDGDITYTDSTLPLDIDFRIKADSLSEGSFRTGEVLAFGSLAGSIYSPAINCRIDIKKMMYGGISFGNQGLIVTADKQQHCTFKSIDDGTYSPIIVSGIVDSLFAQHPSARFAGTITTDPIKEFLARNNHFMKIDSAFLKFSGTGWFPKITVVLDAFAASDVFYGTIRADLRQLESDTGIFLWKMHTMNSLFNKMNFTASAEGLLTADAVIIETLSLFKGISGSGMLYYTTDPPSVEARLDYHAQISDLLTYLPVAADIPPVENGAITGFTLISGTTDSLCTQSNIQCKDVSLSGIHGFSTIVSVATTRSTATVKPFTINRNRMAIMHLDTIYWTNSNFSFNGEFHHLTPELLFGRKFFPLEKIDARISGSLASSGNGFPIQFNFTSPFASVNDVLLDSLDCSGCIETTGINVTSFTFADGPRTKGSIQGFIPWSFLGKHAADRDTLTGELRLKGDLLATIGKNIKSPIGGHGKGTADISFSTAGGTWKFTKGTIAIPPGSGILEVKPFVPDKVRNYTCLFSIDTNGMVQTAMSGTIRHRPISIVSEHTIPDGYEPILIGPLDFGMFQTITPKKGVDLHLPGFMALKERGDIEFAGKSPFTYFTISGPIDRLKLTGTWLLRDLEFTFPFLPTKETDWESNPFPYITWEMDVKPGNRRAMYYWDLSGKKNRFLRFMEGYLDLSSIVKLRGRDLDKSFQILGSIRSFKGAVYYGRVFNRYFDVGVEFNPQKPDKNGKYDNYPLLWGSAETFADTSRHKRIKLTCMVNDPVTGAISEKGRLVDGAAPNISFHLSSDFEDLPGEGERDFYRQAGLTFTTISGAGGVVTDFGEQMFHRYLLQRWERRIAKKLGLDVINIESSIVSNYFNKLYERQFDGLLSAGDHLALANVGVTVGRYFFRDNFFLKARGELIPIDMMLTPEYSIGFEFQPSRFILMDINLGFHKTETAAIAHNPLLMLQLRLPITNLRRSLNF